MIDPRDIALITCIDANKKVVVEDYKMAYRFFEQEAIRCYMAWRKNGGMYKGINIYCLNSKGPILQKTTLQNLKSLGVTYIEDYNKLIASSQVEFIDKLYAQQFLESSPLVHEKYLIYLDLDVFLVKEFPMWFFDEICKGNILLAKHDKVTGMFDNDFLYRYNVITKYFNGNCYNAYFVVEDKHSKFFATLYDLIHSPKYKSFYDSNVLLKEDKKKNDYYLFEETLYDYQWYLNIFNNIVNLNISEIENVYFKHQHMTFKDMIQFMHSYEFQF